MDSKALTTMSQDKMLERIASAKFPQELTAPEKKMLAMVAISYGFDPLMGEITIYQGRPFVSIDGRYRKAQETGNFIGIRTRPATKQEKTDWEIPDGDYFFHSEVFVKGGGQHSFEGWGRVRKAEITPGGKFKPVDVNPQRMAEKRAEAQALRKAFHINLPSLEAKDTGDEDDTPPVNMETGEIIDTTLEETPEQKQAVKEQAEADIKTLYDDIPSANQKPAPAAPPAKTKPSRDPAGIKTLSDLWKACKEDFNLMPPAVCQKLGVNDANEITDTPRDCYARVLKQFHPEK